MLRTDEWMYRGGCCLFWSERTYRRLGRLSVGGSVSGVFPPELSTNPPDGTWNET